MISLFNYIKEASLLGDIDDQLDFGDSVVTSQLANANGSEARKAFNLPYDDNPFEFEVSGGHTELRVRPAKFSNAMLSDFSNVHDILGADIDSMEVYGRLVLFNDDINPTLLPKQITADAINILADRINGMTLCAKPMSASKVFCNITAKGAHGPLSIIDSSIELKKSVNADGRFTVVGDIPTFKGFTSETITSLNITTQSEVIKKGEKPADIFGNKLWSKIFDFGYDLGVDKINDRFNPNYGSTISIKGMKSLKKLVTGKDFYNTAYSEWPYKIKHGAKLTDMIDISGLKNLQYVVISDGNRMGVIFENVTRAKDDIAASSTYFTDILKISYNKEYNRSNITSYIPTTADGWRVILFRI